MSARKGFVFSLIAMSFMMLLILMAVAMANEYRENERVEAAPVPNSFAAASLDNIGGLAADLLLPSASVAAGGSGATFSVSDTLPRQIDSAGLSGLKSYAEGQFAAALHANITLNTTQVENNSLDLRVMDGFVFQSTMDNASSMVFRGLANESSTNATEYVVTLFINDYRSSVVDFNYVEDGPLNVTVRYSDRNGTDQTTGSLDPNAENHLVINYDYGEADIVIGKVPGNGTHYDGALMMDLANERAMYSFSADLPLQPANSSNLIVFPVRMAYTQDGVSKTMNASR
jgi:hypothetical protein